MCSYSKCQNVRFSQIQSHNATLWRLLGSPVGSEKVAFSRLAGKPAIPDQSPETPRGETHKCPIPCPSIKKRKHYASCLHGVMVGWEVGYNYKRSIILLYSAALHIVTLAIKFKGTSAIIAEMSKATIW